VDRRRSEHEDTGVPRELRDATIPSRPGISCVMCFIEYEQIGPALRGVASAQSFISDESSVYAGPRECISPH
jgi:hypothetical protein